MAMMLLHDLGGLRGGRQQGYADDHGLGGLLRLLLVLHSLVRFGLGQFYGRTAITQLFEASHLFDFCQF